MTENDQAYRDWKREFVSAKVCRLFYNNERLRREYEESLRPKPAPASSETAKAVSVPTASASEAPGDFVSRLSDYEVLARYPQFASAVASWRNYASAVGYNGPVAWKVKEGFTLKIHAPKAGPCCQDLGYLQNWQLKNDVPTVNSVVFWVPKLAEGSLNKTAEEMKELQAKLREQYLLPRHHCNDFGSIALLFALILAHFKRTGERVPANFLYAASDSFLGVGYRLVAGGFDEDGLGCNDWFGLRRDFVGCFVLGVEVLGN